MFLNKKYILHSDSDDNVKQFHFSNFQIFGLVLVCLVVLSSFLLVGADYLSNSLYDKRLKEFKSSYSAVSGNINAIQSRLKELDQQILDIEEKDKAVTRKYVDLHIDMGIEAMTKIGDEGERIKHFKY